jgi:hypothetical protein
VVKYLSALQTRAGNLPLLCHLLAALDMVVNQVLRLLLLLLLQHLPVLHKPTSLTNRLTVPHHGADDVHLHLALALALQLLLDRRYRSEEVDHRRRRGAGGRRG